VKVWVKRVLVVLVALVIMVPTFANIAQADEPTGAESPTVLGNPKHGTGQYRVHESRKPNDGPIIQSTSTCQNGICAYTYDGGLRYVGVSDYAGGGRTFTGTRYYVNLYGKWYGPWDNLCVGKQFCDLRWNLGADVPCSSTAVWRALYNSAGAQYIVQHSGC
jgi:hypothetical protein